MLPTLYPHDRLYLREARPSDLVVGAIVAFPGRGRVVCHRVVGAERRADGRWLELRGDAQAHGEWAREDAIAWTLVEVDGRLGRWRVDGRRGRALTWLALGGDPVRRTGRSLAVVALKSLARLRRASEH